MKDNLREHPAGFVSDTRERLVDRIGSDFYDLEMQITTGLEVLLESKGVSPEVLEAVTKYIGDVVKGMGKLEANVVRLADVPGAPEAGYGLPGPFDPISGTSPQEHGYSTLAAFFQEIRADEMAAKHDPAHSYGKDALQKILHGKGISSAPEAAKSQDKDQGIEL